MRRRYKLHIASSAKLAGSNSANLIYADHCYWRLCSLGPNANSTAATSAAATATGLRGAQVIR